MHYLEIALLVLGVATLAVGYRGNQRNLLLAAAVMLLLAGASGSAVKEFADGFAEGAAHSRNA